ncbi:MAG TPA: M50 family metallopeptidase [Longimicrobiales bacterium]|jgi:hypothetical protein
MKRATKKKLAFLGGFAAYFGALWLLWGTPVVYPLKIFVVLLHETSHALALWATGGTVERITLNAAQGGATYGYGGSAFITLSAGYLGSLLWGVVLALSANTRRVRANLVVGLLGGLVAGLTLLYVRSVFGVGFGVLFAVALVGVAARLPLVWNRGVLTVLGMTSCLYAILDIKSDVLDRPELRSDAAMLAELTGVPTLAWGTLWIAVALVVCFFLARALWKKA